MGNKSGKKNVEQKDHPAEKPSRDLSGKAKEKPKKGLLASLFRSSKDRRKSAGRASGPKKKCSKVSKLAAAGQGAGSAKKSLPKKSLVRRSLPKKSLTRKSLPQKNLPKRSMAKKTMPKRSVTKKSFSKKGASTPNRRKSNSKAIKKRPTVVFIIGGPGSGKGTQCEKAEKQFHFTHLSTGDLLRLEVSSGTERGKKVQGIMTRGELVPLDTVLTLLQEAVAKVASSTKGFLIDGYPRNVEQGTRFEAEVQPVDCIIYFHVSDETMTKRLLKRAETSGRADDNAETIKQRLITFHAETQPVIDHYKKQNKVHQIEAEGGVDEIFAKVVAVLSKA